MRSVRVKNGQKQVLKSTKVTLLALLWHWQGFERKNRELQRVHVALTSLSQTDEGSGLPSVRPLEPPITSPRTVTAITVVNGICLDVRMSCRSKLMRRVYTNLTPVCQTLLGNYRANKTFDPSMVR